MNNMRQSFLIVIFLLASLIVSAQQWLPQYGDSEWRNSIPASMRQSYVAFGEQYLGKTWNSLSVVVFAEYKKTGNRSHYESLMFEKRRQLSALVMAEMVEGKGRFMSDIVNGLYSTLEETWWGVPAHYDSEVPLADDQLVDLFNAETASLVAYIRQVLFSELKQFSPSLIERIDSEISRRVLQPALTSKSWWKNATNNWNPWTCSNWLACVLFCEHDENQKKEAINQINKACEVFINAYPEDGGCDEGPNYWDRAAASLFEVCYLLSENNIRSSVMLDNPKLKKMGSYIYKMYVGNGYAVNFADTHGNRAVLSISIAYPFGLKVGDKQLCQYAAWMGREKDLLHNSAQLFNQYSNWPSLGRELIFLSHIQSYLNEEPREPLIDNNWLPDLQVMTSRTSSPNSFYIAYKGGNNGESHNHNDVGSFLVYANGNPLFIDLGVSEYNAKTFSESRYDIWTMQSDYHNLPLINGQSQKDGKQYCAEVIGYRKGQLTLDISKAYPEEARVNRWYRTISTRSRKRIEVTEDFELGSYETASQLIFVTPVNPIISKDGVITIGDCSISFNSSQLSSLVENLSSLVDPVLARIWGKNLYRIVLTVRSPQLKQRIRYNIAYN